MIQYIGTIVILLIILAIVVIKMKEFERDIDKLKAETSVNETIIGVYEEGMREYKEENENLKKVIDDKIDKESDSYTELINDTMFINLSYHNSKVLELKEQIRLLQIKVEKANARAREKEMEIITKYLSRP